MIRDAAHVVECELVNDRVVAAPLETRGALGEFDASSGRLHLTAPPPARTRSATCSPTPSFVWQ